MYASLPRLPMCGGTTENLLPRHRLAPLTMRICQLDMHGKHQGTKRSKVAPVEPFQHRVLCQVEFVYEQSFARLHGQHQGPVCPLHLPGSTALSFALQSLVCCPQLLTQGCTCQHGCP